MSTSPFNPEDNKPLLVRRGRVESVDLYEIKDTELELFEKGSPADLQLNFSIFLLSTAFSSIVALFTATFANSTVHIVFVVVAVVGVLIGGYLLIAWSRNRTSARAACAIVRRRIKETTAIVSPVASTNVEPPNAGEAREPKG